MDISAKSKNYGHEDFSVLGKNEIEKLLFRKGAELFYGALGLPYFQRNPIDPVLVIYGLQWAPMGSNWIHFGPIGAQLTENNINKP